MVDAANGVHERQSEEMHKAVSFFWLPRMMLTAVHLNLSIDTESRLKGEETPQIKKIEVLVHHVYAFQCT